MRNFKKFLALVLAMLMVSACAVSVSAYADQAAIDATGYADAVAVLSDLGVIKGDGENFRPEGTLTRAEAAVIAAKLYAGADGQKFDWTAATTSFVDVDAAWSFAYINYVSQRGIMDGVGDGKFNPNGTLTLAQALTIAVKVAGLQSEVATLSKDNTPAYWAAHWIATAGKYEFDKGLNVWDYDAACSRATMAQIAYNVLNYEKAEGVFPFKDAFDLKVAYKQIASVSDVVTFSDKTTANLAAFNAKLAAAGFEGTAADYIDHNVTITYADKANVIYSVDITSASKVFDYNDGVLANVMKDNKPTEKVTIDGVEYTLAVTAGSEEDKKDGLGSGTAVVNSIVAEGIEANKALPEFYKAIALDDNDDGKYDRLLVDVYNVAVLTKGSEVDHDGKADTAKVWETKVDYFGDLATVVCTPATVVGAISEPTWNEVPVLVYVEGNTINVLEVAEKVTGVVSNIKTGENGYVTIGKAYTYVNAYVAVPNWTLGQNVSIYTIGGEYVTVASADTGIESGMVEKDILVDKVVIEDGKAVISGYYYGAKFEAVTLKVAGIDNGKLVARNAYLDDKDNAIDYNKDGKVDDADKAFVAVALGTNKKDDGTIEGKVVIEDNIYYTFKITSAGAYLVGKSAKTVPATEATNAAVAISGSYIKKGDTAVYRLADSYVVVSEANADTSKAYNYYADTYVVSANGTIVANENLVYAVRDADNAAVTNAVEQKVALVYITGAKTVAVAKTVAGLAEGETIVKITAEESASLDYNTYKALDIFTGAAVEVTGTGAEAGDYAVVKDGKIVTNDTKWIGSHAITVNTVLGQVESVVAYNSYLLCDDDGNVKSLEHKSDDANKVTFGLDNVTIWKLDDNGNFVADTEFSYADKTSVFGFINGGKVVILP